MFAQFRSATYFAMFMLLMGATTAFGEGDIYVSFSKFGAGNASTNTQRLGLVGDVGSVYIWINDNFEIDTGAFFNIETTSAGVIEFTGVEVFNPNITVAGDTVIGQRWEEVDGGTMTANQITNFGAFQVSGSGFGIDSENNSTTSPFSDELHDPTSNAFLFARVDYQIVGTGTTDFVCSSGELGVVHQGSQLNPEFTSSEFNGTDDNGSGSYFGLNIESYGNALIVECDPSMGSVCHDIITQTPGQPGEYGVVIELGSVEAGEFFFDPPNGEDMEEGDYYEITSIGSIDGAENSDLLTLRFERSGEDIETSVDTTNLGATHWLVEAYLDGELVDSQMLVADPSMVPWSYKKKNADGKPAGSVDSGWNLLSAGAIAGVCYPEPSPVTIFGSLEVLADLMVVQPVGGSAAVNRMQARRFGISSSSACDQASIQGLTNIVRGTSVQGFGNAAVGLDNLTGSIAINDFGEPDDGIEIALPDVNKIGIDLNIDGNDIVDPDANASFAVTGTINGTETEFAKLNIIHNSTDDTIELELDALILGAETVRVELSNSDTGESINRNINPSSKPKEALSKSQVQVGAIEIQKNADERSPELVAAVRMDPVTVLTIPGEPFVADQIRFIFENTAIALPTIASAVSKGEVFPQVIIDRVSVSSSTSFETRADFEAAVPGLPTESFENVSGIVSTSGVDELGLVVNSETNQGPVQPGDIQPGVTFFSRLGLESLQLLNPALGPSVDSNFIGFENTDSNDGMVIRFDEPVNAIAIDVHAFTQSTSEPQSLIFRTFDVDGFQTDTLVIDIPALTSAAEHVVFVSLKGNSDDANHKGWIEISQVANSPVSNTLGFGIDNLTFGLVESELLGDVNCDGVVNLLDVSPFVDLISTDSYEFKADINQDGVVNLLDVAPFIDLLSMG